MRSIHLMFRQSGVVMTHGHKVMEICFQYYGATRIILTVHDNLTQIVL